MPDDVVFKSSAKLSAKRSEEETFSREPSARRMGYEVPWSKLGFNPSRLFSAVWRCGQGSGARTADNRVKKVRDARDSD